MKQTRSWIKSGLALMSLLGLCMPMAQAQVVQEVIVGTTPSAAAVTTTGNRVDAGQDVLFRVINPTARQVNFTIPDLGISYPIPAGTERTFFLNMGNVLQRQVAYRITDPAGTQLAGGVLVNEDFYTAADATALALANIINYSSAYSAPIDPEPEYIDERPAVYQQPVRGYW